MVRDKKKKGGRLGGGFACTHTWSLEKNVPFEVAFLHETSFALAWIVKQTIKHNGLGGLQSFISEGKNKVHDDPGDSGDGLDGNSHTCWNSLL